MKIVHATWERRNLGVDCREINVEPDDGVDGMAQALREHEAEYTVVRLPVARIDLLFRAQDLGYRFIETITYCYHAGGTFNLNPIQQRIVDRITWRPADDAGLADVFERIEQGMFSTDRVALDPQFGPKAAARRYVYWIQDELARGGRVYTIFYGERELGFFSLKRQGNGETFAFLSGTYAAFRNSGFGFACHYCEVVEGLRSGAKRVMTSYSSNNRGAAAVHLSIGHVLHQQCYLLVKHGPRSEN